MRHYVILRKESTLLPGTWITQHWYSPIVDEPPPEWTSEAAKESEGQVLVSYQQRLEHAGYQLVTGFQHLAKPDRWNQLTLEEIFALKFYSITAIEFDQQGKVVQIEQFRQFRRTLDVRQSSSGVARDSDVAGGV